MQFVDYLSILRRRLRLIIFAVLLTVGAAAAVTALQEPLYSTSTRLLVSASSNENAVDEITKRQLAAERAVAYAQYLSTGPAIAAVVEEAGAVSPPSVTAFAAEAAPFLSITVTSRDPQEAAAVANAYADVLPDVVSELDQTQPGFQRPNLSVLEPAGVPTQPTSPRPVRNLVIGFLLGLAIGFAAALLRESLDATVRTSAELERVTNVGLLGTVPREFANERLIAASRPQSRRTEAYRQIRTNLEFTGSEGAPRSLVITSAGPGEGKTTVATNLALIASLAGRSVVLVDADLRKPRVHDVMRVAQVPGLSQVLTGAASLEAAIQQLPGERLSILASGPPPAAPSELLGSSAMVEVIEELERRFDLVIIDTAPVLPVTDGLVVGVNTGGVVLVVRLSETVRPAIRRAVDSVTRVNARLLGLVANGATDEEDQRYGYGYGYLNKQTTVGGADLRPADHIQAGGRRSGPPTGVES